MPRPDTYPQAQPASRAEWRQWLAEHHASASGVWLVYCYQLAAPQLMHVQRDTIAPVASVDGLFTVFAWSEDLQLVLTHKIDVLLL